MKQIRMLFMGFLIVGLAPILRAESPTESIAPLLDEQVLVLIHADLRTVDLDESVKRGLELVDWGLPQLGFDAPSIKGIRRELDLLLPKKLPLLKKPLDRLTQDAGVLDLFLIVSGDELPFVAIPLKGKTEAQKKTIREIFDAFCELTKGESHQIAFEEKGFFLIVVGETEDLAQCNADQLRARLKDLKPVPVPEIDEALKLHDPCFLKGAVIVPKDYKTKILPALETTFETATENEPLEQVRKTLHQSTAKVRFVSFGVDLAKMNLRAVLQTVDEKSAREIESDLGKMIEIVAGEIEQKPSLAEGMESIENYLKEMGRGAALKLLPVREGDRFVKNYKMSDFPLFFTLLTALAPLNENVENQ